MNMDKRRMKVIVHFYFHYRFYFGFKFFSTGGESYEKNGSSVLNVGRSLSKE